MAKLIKLILLGCLIMACSSCKTSKSVTTNTTTKDSVNVDVRTVIKDSIVYTKVDSAAIKALVKCPDGKLINMPAIVSKSKTAKASFEIKNGIAIAKCVCDSQAIVNRTTSVIKTKFQQRLNSISKAAVIEKKVTPPWVVKLVATLSILLAVSILVVIKLLKK
jgi:hypothetical protein